MIVQIYEIQTPKEAEGCIEAGVDHVGSVILSKDEWKRPEIRDTVRVSEGTTVKNSIIPLFQDVDAISRLVDYYRPDFIHLCESLTDNQGREIDLEPYMRIQAKLKERFPEAGIIRSIPIPVNGSVREYPTIEIARSLESVSDLFLTDTWLGREPVEGFIGITGKICDQQIAGELVEKSSIPVILAGGLSPENAYDAIMNIRPAGADSCTLTNMPDKDGKAIRFKKDFNRVKQFVEEVRRAERDVTRENSGTGEGAKGAKGEAT